MKKLFYIGMPVIAGLLMLAFAFSAKAAPISWDFASGVLQPLQSAWSAVVKGSYFQATSTAAVNLFPQALFTQASSTEFCLIGDNCITVWPTGGSSTGLATSSPVSAGDLLYYNATGAGSATGVSTTTLTASSPLSLSQPISVIGSSASALTLATTTNSLFSGTAGQVLAFINNGWFGVATTTFSNGLTYTNGNVENTLTAGDGLTRTLADIDCDTASGSVFGCLTSTDWNTFNNKLGSYDAWTHPVAGQSATTSLLQFFGQASTSQFTATSSTYLATESGNVGIGTTTPPQALTVSGNGYFTGPVGIGAEHTGSGIFIFAGGTAPVTPAATSVATFQRSNGGASFDVIASVTGNAIINLGDTDSVQRGRIIYDNSDDSLRFAVAGSGRLYIPSNGNVGAGSSTPTFQLSVGSSGTGTFGIATSTAGLLTIAATGEVYSTGITNPTISGITLGSNLADLTATNSTLTFSGTYNGSTARTIGLNLGNANTWTALQTFSSNASTTQLTSTGSSYLATTGGQLGVGTTSPWAKLSLDAPTGVTPFAIGSSTASLFRINDYGQIAVAASQPATTTTITLDWSKTPQQVEYRIGTSATTITLINATTSAMWGSTKRVYVCNPGATAGALTWAGAQWIGGTVPTQTTTANKCDLYSFNVTRATSSSAYIVAGTAGTGL